MAQKETEASADALAGTPTVTGKHLPFRSLGEILADYDPLTQILRNLRPDEVERLASLIVLNGNPVGDKL